MCFKCSWVMKLQQCIHNHRSPHYTSQTLYDLIEPENINYERGHFVYTRDNHTSVLGLREIANESGAKIHCLEHDQAFREFKKIGSLSENSITSQGNSLFVYPAQCNFSGCKYPLQWIEQIHNGILNEFITGSSNTPR